MVSEESLDIGLIGKTCLLYHCFPFSHSPTELSDVWLTREAQDAQAAVAASWARQPASAGPKQGNSRDIKIQSVCYKLYHVILYIYIVDHMIVV